MKYNKILSAALIVFAATSCNKYLPEDMSNRNLEPMTIAGSETKTVFNQADGTVKWTTGDVIAIFDNLGGRNGFTNTADAPSSFSGNVTAGTTKFWGVYPGTRVESFSNGTAILKLPNIQTIAGNTFAEDLNLSVTTGNKTPGEPIVEGIKFHNVCGMVSFTLPARVSASKVSFTASNRALAGNLSVNCENCTATVIDDDEASNTVSMSGNFPAGSRFYFVVAPGKIEGFSIEVSTAKGSIYGKGASQGEIDASAGKLVNLPEINYTDGTVTATAGHIYDQDTKVLTGSTLTVNHGIPQAIWKDVTAINITVSKGGKPYRTFKSNSVTEESVVPEGNIYLPQGEYTVSGTYTTNGVQTEIQTKVTLPAPKGISLSAVSGTTSYSLANKGNISSANEHAPEEITGLTAKINGVSAEVLAECPATYSFTAGGKSASGLNSTISGLAWGSHTLSCSASFDGVTVSANSQEACHITGLPYTYSFVNGSLSEYQKDGWSTNGSLEVSNKSLAGRENTLLLDRNGSWSNKHGFIVSPKFHILTNKNIIIQPSVFRSVYRSSGSKTRKGYIGVVSSTSETSNTITYNTDGGTSTGGKIVGTDESLSTLTLTNSSPYISIDCDKRSEAGWSYYFLHGIKLLYAAQ